MKVKELYTILREFEDSQTYKSTKIECMIASIGDITQEDNVPEALRKAVKLFQDGKLTEFELILPVYKFLMDKWMNKEKKKKK